MEYSTKHKLEQLERLHSEDTPRRLMITHTIESYWIPSQKKQSQSYKFKKFAKIFDFWNGHYTRHTFGSCLIRCANMKWIQWVFLKIQSGRDSVHRWTDGQGDTSIPPFQLRWSGGYNCVHISWDALFYRLSCRDDTHLFTLLDGVGCNLERAEVLVHGHLSFLLTLLGSVQQFQDGSIIVNNAVLLSAILEEILRTKLQDVIQFLDKTWNWLIHWLWSSHAILHHILVNISSENVLSPMWYQAINWTNVDLLSINPNCYSEVIGCISTALCRKWLQNIENTLYLY